MPTKLTATTALLVAVVILAVLGRSLTGVQRVEARADARLSGDEVVYLLLGDRLWHEGRYTTKGVERFLPLQRTIVPGYLHADVFKHPPVYPALVGGSRWILDGSLPAAYYPNLLLAAVSIIGTFLLCRELRVSPSFSLLAALFVAVSPVHWIASSRIWLDLALSTFVTLALLFHLRASRTERWWLSGLAWCAAVLTKAVGAVPWVAAVLMTIAFDSRARRSRRFWFSQAAVAAALAAWFVVLTANEHASILASRMSLIDDARTLLRILPLFVLAAVVSTPILWLWRPSVAGSSTPPGSVLLIASAAFVLLAVVGGVGGALLERPWTGWDRNLLIEYGPAFYWVYPALYDPIVLLGICALLLVPDRPGALPVRSAWLALIVFLTVWGNYQTRYNLPILQIEIVFATLVAGATWTDPRTSPAQRALIVGWVAASIIRSSWVVVQLRSNDFFYF